MSIFSRTPLPTSAAQPEYQTYDTMDSTAIGAFVRAKTLSGGLTFEFAGGIIKDQSGAFYFTEPTQSASVDSFGVKLIFPATHRLAAIYHTHPTDSKDDKSELFSPNDVEIATRMNLTSYVYVVKNNAIICYVPGKDRTVLVDNMGDIFAKTKASYGHEVYKFT